MSESHTPRWPHAPAHLRDARGAVMVTAATYRQVPRFNSRAKLDFLQAQLFELADQHGLALQAWAIFPNHYHFIAHIERATTLGPFIRKLHAAAGNFLNQLDSEKGRQVWFQYWDTKLTFERSYFARLNYVHRNAVHHRIAKLATRYPWCSAAWFEREAAPSFRDTVLRFPTDKLKVRDPFEVKRADFDLT